MKGFFITGAVAMPAEKDTAGCAFCGSVMGSREILALVPGPPKPHSHRDVIQVNESGTRSTPQLG